MTETEWKRLVAAGTPTGTPATLVRLRAAHVVAFSNLAD